LKNLEEVQSCLADCFGLLTMYLDMK